MVPNCVLLLFVLHFPALVMAMEIAKLWRNVAEVLGDRNGDSKTSEECDRGSGV